MRHIGCIRALVFTAGIALLALPAVAAPTYTVTDLGTLGGTNSQGYGINASGQVTGWSQTTGNVAPHAFIYNGSSMQDLGTLGGSNSYGMSINATGQVTGWASTSGGDYRAFRYNGGCPARC